jgi:hypothetical protein
MAKKRYSRLKYGLDILRPPNSTAPAPDAPVGTVARKYQDYAGKKVKLTYVRSATSKPEALLKVSILPFYYGGVAGTEAIVNQSKRADIASNLGGIQTQCNQVTVNFDTHKKLSNFIPAKVTVHDFTNTVTKEVSKITGLNYDKKAGASYTFPFGATTTEKSPSEVIKGILAAVNTLGTASASFTPEKYIAR